MYQWQLQYNCSTAKVANTSQPLHRSTCFPSKSPHTTSHYTTASPDAPNNSTPSTAEQRVLGHLTRRMMTSSSVYGSDNTITVPTGEQVCCRNKTKQNHFTLSIVNIHSTTWIVKLTRAQYKTKTHTNFMITYMHKVNLEL